MQVGDLVTISSGGHDGYGILVTFEGRGSFGSICVVLWDDNQVSRWNEADLKVIS
jgi:hypothetical protein